MDEIPNPYQVPQADALAPREPRTGRRTPRSVRWLGCTALALCGLVTIVNPVKGWLGIESVALDRTIIASSISGALLLFAAGAEMLRIRLR